MSGRSYLTGEGKCCLNLEISSCSRVLVIIRSTMRHIVHLELNLPCSVAEGFDAEKFLYVTAFLLSEEISWTHDSCSIFSTASHYMDFVY